MVPDGMMIASERGSTSDCEFFSGFFCCLEERNGGEPCVRCHLTPHLHHHPTVVVEWFQAVAAFHRITPYRCKTLLSGSHSLLLSLSSPLLLPPPSLPHIWSHAAIVEEWRGRDKAGGSSTSLVNPPPHKSLSGPSQMSTSGRRHHLR